jgi:hypothetical protein
MSPARVSLYAALAASIGITDAHQTKAQARVLRLLCEGQQESSELGAVARKQEQKKIQMTINLASGAAQVEGLLVFTRAAGPNPIFVVSETELRFYEENDREPTTSSRSSLVVDRYSGVLREMQTLTLKQGDSPPWAVQGQYQCTKLDAPIF